MLSRAKITRTKLLNKKLENDYNIWVPGVISIIMDYTISMESHESKERLRHQFEMGITKLRTNYPTTLRWKMYYDECAYCPFGWPMYYQTTQDVDCWCGYCCQNLFTYIYIGDDLIPCYNKNNVRQRLSISVTKNNDVCCRCRRDEFIDIDGYFIRCNSCEQSSRLLQRSSHI